MGPISLKPAFLGTFFMSLDVFDDFPSVWRFFNFFDFWAENGRVPPQNRPFLGKNGHFSKLAGSCGMGPISMKPGF